MRVIHLLIGYGIIDRFEHIEHSRYRLSKETTRYCPDGNRYFKHIEIDLQTTDRKTFNAISSKVRNYWNVSKKRLKPVKKAIFNYES